MKRFLGTYLACLVVLVVFLFFGGWMLFDFNRHWFTTGAAIAFVLAVLLSAWMSQEEKIDALEKRIQSLEASGGSGRSDSEPDSDSSDSKENDQ